MSVTLTSRVAVIGLVLVLLSSGLVAGVTLADDVNNESEDENGDVSTTAFDVDEDVRVTAVDYSTANETLEVDVHNRGDDRETLMLIEVVEAGADSFGFLEVSLAPGEETTVVLEGVADREGGEAVMVATETSLEDQSVEWITTGEAVEPTTVTLTQGVVIGIATMGTIVPLMAWRVYNKPGKEPESALKDDKGWR